MIFSNIVGRILEWKGLHIYLEAIKSVGDVGRFELVGRKEKSSEDYFVNLNGLIGKLDSKIVVRDFIDDMRSYYSSIDVVVHTAIEEDPLPTVLLEGLAMGKVLIASDVGGVREIVDESCGNIVVPPGSAKELKCAIERVASYSTDQIKEIESANISRAKEKFSLRNQLGVMEKLYLDICRK